MKVLTIYGAHSPDDVPGLSRVVDLAEIRFASNRPQLRDALHGSEILVIWNRNSGPLAELWDVADQLRWLHWSNVGVDSLLFPKLVQSDVVLTNARGVYDEAIAEYVLGLIFLFAKRFPESIDYQSRHEWRQRVTARVRGQTVAIIGVGSIGNRIARHCTAAGLNVFGIGTRARTHDRAFDVVYAHEELDQKLQLADYVVIAAPLTKQTHRMISTAQFENMRSSASLINVGRGAVIDESALLKALSGGKLAGAALDVFETEPLPVESPIWSNDRIIVSPHMSCDLEDTQDRLAQVFLENFDRYLEGRPLHNVVNKAAGYVRSSGDQSDVVS